MTMTAVTDIKIDTSKTDSGNTVIPVEGGGNRRQVTVKSAKVELWDNLSRAFKKYTHTIQYPERGSDYLPSNYNITVVGPGGSSGINQFTYLEPKLRVDKVEVFFKNEDDSSRAATNPLVVGFINLNWRESHGNYSRGTKGCKSIGDNGSKCYYTWKYLTSTINRKFNDDVKLDEAISDKDLITRLIEEMNPIVATEKKFVIRLNEKPTDSFSYPESGSNLQKINVKKDTDFGFDKYVHTIHTTTGSDSDDINDSVGLSEFYLSYYNNSMYFKTDDESEHSLREVTVYYETGSGDSKTPVLIVLSLTYGSELVYEYSQFVRDLKTLNHSKPKKTTQLKTIDHNESGLSRKLNEEKEKLRQLIAFKKDTRSGRSDGRYVNENENVKKEEKEIGKGKGKEKFIRVTMKPNTTDEPNGEGSSVGPWTVYNGSLITLEQDMKIDDKVLNDITTNDVGSSNSKKYKSINVYYAMTPSDTRDSSKHMALLVEFDQAVTSTSSGGNNSIGETKIYYRRGNHKGNKWVIAENIGIVTRGDSHMIPILQDESNKLKQITFLTGDSSFSGGNLNIMATEPGEIDQDDEEKKFKKVVMTANTGAGGNPDGPWEVRNKGLFTHESDIKFQKERLGVISGKQYSSITVYYILKGCKDYKALLVEFDNGDGSKTYIKRKDPSGTKWASADRDIGSDGNVDADILTDIKSNSGIGVAAREIQIYTDKTKGSHTDKDPRVRVKVTPENPWDKLSMLFKKYTHAIQYPESACYESSDYKITVFGKGGFGFTLNEPNPKVDAVELYFRFTDVNNKNPLILGFVYDRSSDCSRTGCSSNICYYKWTNVKSRQFDRTIGTDEAISPQDLVTVLLEIGSTVTSRLNNFVVSLDETPGYGVGVVGRGEGRSQYPDSGHNKGKKITVNKQDSGVSGVVEYDVYEHTFSSSADSNGGASECYVTYERNSRYFMTATSARLWVGTWSWKGKPERPSNVVPLVKDDKIKTVTAYYEKGTTTCTATAGNNSKKLLLITFTLTSGSTYVYTYSDFIKDLKEVRSDNKIIETELHAISVRGGIGSDLKPILKDESEKLKQITFVTGDISSSGDHEHISTSKPQEVGGQGSVDLGNKFMKVTMTPDLGSRPGGPWKVYNNYLFTLEPDKKIQPENVLTRIATSSSKNEYHSITVYYSPEGIGNYMALLVEFDNYGSKTYIIRLNKGGTKWAVTTAASIGISVTGDSDGYDKALLPILREQWERLTQLIAFVKGESSKNNENISTDKKDVDQEKKFIKYTMKPNTKKAKSGPWIVYSDNLVDNEQDAKIDEKVLESIFTNNDNNKYKSINVYYAMIGNDSGDDSKHMALLVEFEKGDGSGTKIYIKRTGVNGTSWERVPGIGIRIDIGFGNGEVTANDLTLIAKEAGIIVTSDISRGVGLPTSSTNARLDSWLGTGLGLGIGLGPRVMSSLARRRRLGLGSKVVSSLGRRLGFKGADSLDSDTTSIPGDSSDSIPKETGAARPIVEGQSSVSDPGSHDSPGPPSPIDTREVSEESRAPSGGSSTVQSLENHSPTSRTGENPGGSQGVNDNSSREDGRRNNSDPTTTDRNNVASDPGGGGGGSDDSSATMGEAVGGGVSILVAGGSTGFGIYRYRHFFLH